MAAALFSLFLWLLSHAWKACCSPSDSEGPEVESQRSVPKLKRSFKIKSPESKAYDIFTFKCMCQKLKSCFDCSSWIVFSPVLYVKGARAQWPCGLASKAAQRSVSSASHQSGREAQIPVAARLILQLPLNWSFLDKVSEWKKFSVKCFQGPHLRYPLSCSPLYGGRGGPVGAACVSGYCNYTVCPLYQIEFTVWCSSRSGWQK